MRKIDTIHACATTGRIHRDNCIFVPFYRGLHITLNYSSDRPRFRRTGNYGPASNTSDEADIVNCNNIVVHGAAARSISNFGGRYFFSPGAPRFVPVLVTRRRVDAPYGFPHQAAAIRKARRPVGIPGFYFFFADRRRFSKHVPTTHEAVQRIPVVARRYCTTCAPLFNTSVAAVVFVCSANNNDCNKV